MGKIEKDHFNCFTSEVSHLDHNKISCDLKIGLFLSKNSPLILTVISSLGFL